MKRKTKRLLINTAVVIVVGVVAWTMSYYYFGVVKNSQIIKSYEAKISEYSASNTLKAYVLKKDVKANDKIKIEDLDEIKLSSKAKSENLISDALLLSKSMYSRDIKKGTIIYKNMTYGENSIRSDLRKFEISSLVLPVSSKKGDYVDVRINFPSGLDYVVLSKKRIEDLARIDNEKGKREICLFYLNSEEILRLSSALVDAYIAEGAYMYTTVYVSPNNQTAAAITYPSNDNVQKLIKSDPNVVNRAIIKLEDEKREQLNRSISGLINKKGYELKFSDKEDGNTKAVEHKKNGETKKNQDDDQDDDDDNEENDDDEQDKFKEPNGKVTGDDANGSNDIE